MNEFPNVYPLFDGIVADGPLPTREGSCIFSALQQETGKKLTVTRISIPESQANANALAIAGLIDTQHDADAYYRSEVARYKEELAAFARLSKYDSICGFLRYQVVPKEESAGYDIYILSKRRISLKEFLKTDSLSYDQGIQLALDLCQAASDLRKEGYVHRHITNSSICLNNGHFCIGGLGICKLDSLQSETIPTRYITPFTPPELCSLSAHGNDTIDLYAIGMVLYYVFNGNHFPFEEAGSSLQNANKRRISGEDLPAPIYADYELYQIIHKACAFNPEERYQTASDFKHALEDYLAESPVNESPIIPPIVSDSEAIVEEAPEQLVEDETADSTDSATISDEFKETFTPHGDRYLNKKKHIWPFILLALLVLLAGAFCYYRFYYSAVTVQSIEVTNRGVDYLTVSVASNNYDALTITCKAEDGSYSESFLCSDTQTFGHLNANTVYNIQISASERTYLKGSTSLSSATLGYTTVSDFSMNVLEDGTASLTMQVSGPEPDTWELISFCNNEQVGSYSVVNHSCFTDILTPNTLYTFILNPGSEYYVSGALETTAIRAIEIHGQNLNIGYDGTSKTITATWEADSEFETQWTVSCSGGNGYHESIQTNDYTYVFSDIIGNAEYTVNVSNDSSAAPLISTITVPAGTVAGLKAEETEEGILVSWNYDGNYEIDGWKISLTNADLQNTEEYETKETSYLITDYLPNASYEIELSTVYVTILEGDSKTTLTTKEAESFSDNSDHKLGGTYTALYEVPCENWTLANLKTARNSFTVDTPFILLIQAINIPKDTEEPEEIQVLLTIRDENGKLCYADSYDSTWNDVWDVNLFADELKTPSQAGKYTAEVYFNRYLLCTSTVTVKE